MRGYYPDGPKCHQVSLKEAGRLVANKLNNLQEMNKFLKNTHPRLNGENRKSEQTNRRRRTNSVINPPNKRKVPGPDVLIL